MRRDPLVNGEIYHIMSRSIAGFNVFNDKNDFERIIKTIIFYSNAAIQVKLADFLIFSAKRQEQITQDVFSDIDQKIVQIVAYCIMPTHIHLILKQLRDNGISQMMRKSLDSYTRYFNIRHKRKGPLWESRFKNVLVKKDEQFLHLTRYVHLNPVSANLVTKPENWEYSSYREYISEEDKDQICDYNGLVEIIPADYKKFVDSRIAYQKELSRIKRVIIEDPHYG